jgi:hypothetical protein
MLEQNRREQEMMMKNQERINAQHAADLEATRTRGFKSTGEKPESVMAPGKVAEAVANQPNVKRVYGTDAQGRRTMTETFSPDEDQEGTRTFQKVDYLDENGKTRIGSYDTRSGRILRGVDDVYAPVSKNSETDPIKKAKDLRKNSHSRARTSSESMSQWPAFVRLLMTRRRLGILP